MGGNHKRRPEIPWSQIKADFVRGMSAQQCADKYGVSFFTISSRSKREKWGAERKPGFERPVTQQAGGEIRDSLVDTAMQSVEINLTKAADETLSDIERRRAAMIAKSSASTLKDLMTAREKQARIASASRAGSEHDDTPMIVGISVTPQAIPSIEGKIPGYYGPDNIALNEKWDWMRSHYDERGALHLRTTQENDDNAPAL